MTELQKKFEAWWLTKPDDNAPFDDEPRAIIYWAEQAWQHQQQRIDELESKLKIAVDALKTCKTEEYIHWHEEEGYSPFAETKYRKTFKAEKVAAALKQIEAAE
jgi:hypothetical protein